MYCPKCGYEYRDGYTTCSYCGVDLVNEESVKVQNVNTEDGKMKMRLKNHKMELISFLIGLATVAWIFVIIIKDIVSPAPVNMGPESNVFVEMTILILIDIAGLELGIISLFKNGYKKSLAYWGIIINSIIPVTALIGIVKTIIKYS